MTKIFSLYQGRIRQTGLMQIAWNTQSTVNATILRTKTLFFSCSLRSQITFKFVAPLCLHCL